MDKYGLLCLWTDAGDEFRNRLDTLMTQALRKGVPPLFNNLRSLYRSLDKVGTPWHYTITITIVSNIQGCVDGHCAASGQTLLAQCQGTSAAVVEG